MPKAKAKPTLTLGDLLKRISKIQTSQLLYIVLLVAVFLIGYLTARVQGLEKNQGANPGSQNQAVQVPPEKVDVKEGKLPVFGKKNAKVTMIEFSDFECPFCKRYFDETLPQIIKDYVDTGKVKMYYRHFPLDFHPAAMPAALASECANEQGKFWEYHDKVFEEQTQIAGSTPEKIKETLKAWAKEVRLNSTQFDNCLDTEKYKARVEEDLNDGKAAGVSGTPSFFINGKLLVGAQPFAAIKAVIDEELK